MSFDTIHLRKLLKLLYLTPNRQISEIRSDIRQDIAKEEGFVGGGGDFHGPFWADARDHVFNKRDLHVSTDIRLESNPGRERLYPRLRDGFLQWWDQKRRWTNEPFQQISPPHARLTLEGLGTIKIENILSVRDAADVDHFIYPYFAEAPLLTPEAARVGLWVLSTGLPEIPAGELRILDVLRGEPFSIDRVSLEGNEEDLLRRRYRRLLDDRTELLKEYKK